MLIQSLLLAAAAAYTNPPVRRLSVAAAASVAPAIEAVAPLFQRRTGARLVVVSGASGKLLAQIERGAPFDVFVSADSEYPERLRRDGFAAGPPTVYAHGALVAWTLYDIDLATGLRALAEPAVRRIAIADPKVAPYGRAAVQALQAAGLWKDIESKLVFGESAAQVNQFILSKAADAGLTAKSAVRGLKARGVGRWTPVDPKLYGGLPHALVILRRGAEREPALSRAFTRLLETAQARAVLADFGLETP